MKERTLLDRIKDAVLAFRGKSIGSVTFGIDVKKCSGFLRNPDTEVLYLCDGDACGGDCPNPECKHTTDICHAKNFKYKFSSGAFWEIEEEENTNEKEN